MTPHKRKADDADDIAAEAHRRAQSAVQAPSALPAALPAAVTTPLLPSMTTHQMQSNAKHTAVDTHVSSPSSTGSASVAAPSQPFAVASPSSSRSAAEDGQSNAEHVAAIMHGASSLSTAAPSSLAAAPPPPPTAIAPPSSSATGAAGATVQAPHMAVAAFHRLADVEVQLIMQQLEQPDLLRLARCSRALFRCASHPLAWQQLPFPVSVRGSKVREDSRRARSLLHFAPSLVNLYFSHLSPGWNQRRVEASDQVSCATLLRVPDIVALKFQDYFPTMKLEEWHMFLRQPSAQRLTHVSLCRQSAFCEDGSMSLLSQLPLLRTLHLRVPAEPSASYLEPLADPPSLTELILWEPDDPMPQPVPLVQLARCTHLRSLNLHELPLRLGDFEPNARAVGSSGWAAASAVAVKPAHVPDA